MSTWLRLLNDLKQRASVQYLTPTQRAVYTTMCDLTKFPLWLNLCGVHGSGKTFLGWTVSRTIGATYVPTVNRLNAVSQSQNIIIVDNVLPDESSTRRTLSNCELLGANTVILISHERINMPMRRVELSGLSPVDMTWVIQSLARMGYPCNETTLPLQPDLWTILQACV